MTIFANVTIFALEIWWWAGGALLLLTGCFAGGFFAGRADRGGLMRRVADLDRERQAAIAQGQGVSTDLSQARVELARAQERAEQVERMERHVEQLRGEQARLQADARGLQTAMEERERAVAAERAQLSEFRKELDQRMDEMFKASASTVLNESREAFLSQAKQTFEAHNQAAKTDLEKLVKPVAESLTRYEQNLSQIEKARTEAYGSLKAELAQVQQGQIRIGQQAAELTTVLKESSSARGRWGEIQLRNVLEKAGMERFVDFDEQVQVKSGRADAVIRLPGDRIVIIDAKTPMSAYFQAEQSIDDSERKKYLVQHAEQVRTQIKQLSKRDYAQGVEGLDFVIMFMPGEDLFAAALRQIPDLFEEAFSQKVVVATPISLFALARSIERSWQYESMAENVREASDAAHELYKRVVTMTGHIENLGKSLRKSVEHYGAFVGSLESKVLPQGRRIRDLEIFQGGDELPRLGEMLDDMPSEPRRLTAADMAAE